jgi:hypothetical protein
MPSFNVSLPDISTIDMNQAGSGDEATHLQSPSKVCKSDSDSEQSSSSKTTSKTLSRKGKDRTKGQQKKEKRALSETPEEKKKRRQEKKAKKEQKEKKKRRAERKEKRRREEGKEKKEKKIEKELKTRSNRGVEAIETRSSESHDKRRRQQCEEYQYHEQQQQQMKTPHGSIAGNGMVIDTASTNGSIIRNGFIMRDSSIWTTEEMKDELNLLRHNVKTLSCQLKTANETIRQLEDRNARMSDLAVQLVKTEVQLEYTTEENKEYSSHVRTLEQALILQESELDTALTVIRQNVERERVLLKTGETINLSTSEEVIKQFSIRKELLASEEAEEVKAIRGELKQAQQERDMAVDKATAVSIQLAELKAETDVSCDQLTESRALIEQMRALMWQQDPATRSTGAMHGFFWSKDDDKPSMSPNEDECIGSTDDDTSVSSEAWNGCNEMDYHERRQEGACMELTF